MATFTIESETALINFDEFVGDTLLMQFGYCDEKGLPYDLTGSSATLEVRRTRTDLTPLLSLSSPTNISLTPVVDGFNTYNINAEITAAQTLALGAGEFPYFIKVIDSLGKENTLIAGLIRLKRP